MRKELTCPRLEATPVRGELIDKNQWHCMITSIYSIGGSKTNAFRACRNNPCAGKDFNGILRNANTYASAWIGWDNWKAGNSWFDAWDRSPTN